MKKYNYILLGMLSLFFVTTLTSCSDYFDQVPDDRLSLEEIFKTRDGALKYLSNVYTFLPDEFNQRQVHETSLYRTPGPWTGASDETEWTSSGNKAKLINNNSIDATENTMVLYRWKSWYSGIHESAVFTKYVDQAPLTASERAQWKAEAKALRAIYYFYLVRTYGPVPVLEDDYALDTPSNELQLSRSTVDRCFDFIVSELKEAQNAGLLEDASSDKTTGVGRIDKAIAQAFIIEALTYRASWLFNGECTYYADMANPDGTRLFPSQPDAATIKADWQKVVTECQKFFADYGNRFQLMYTDKSGKSVAGPDAEGFNPYESYRRAIRTLFSEMGNNKEMIFIVWIMRQVLCSMIVCPISQVIQMITEVAACWELHKRWLMPILWPMVCHLLQAMQLMVSLRLSMRLRAIKRTALLHQTINRQMVLFMHRLEHAICMLTANRVSMLISLSVILNGSQVQKAIIQLTSLIVETVVRLRVTMTLPVQAIWYVRIWIRVTVIKTWFVCCSA